MARGKHGRKAELRRQEQERRDLAAEQRRLTAEEKARAQLDAELAEMEALADEIVEWKQRLALVRKQELDEVRAEVVELVRMVADLEAEERRRIVKAERNRLHDGAGADYVEAAMKHLHPDWDGIVSAGVDEKSAKKIGAEGVKAIQRARGLRR